MAPHNLLPTAFQGQPANGTLELLLSDLSASAFYSKTQLRCHFLKRQMLLFPHSECAFSDCASQQGHGQ